jgi:hypothetical protein
MRLRIRNQSTRRRRCSCPSALREVASPRQRLIFRGTLSAAFMPNRRVRRPAGPAAEPAHVATRLVLHRVAAPRWREACCGRRSGGSGPHLSRTECEGASAPRAAKVHECSESRTPIQPDALRIPNLTFPTARFELRTFPKFRAEFLTVRLPYPPLLLVAPRACVPRQSPLTRRRGEPATLTPGRSPGGERRSRTRNGE